MGAAGTCRITKRQGSIWESSAKQKLKGSKPRGHERHQT
ncbi:hypothetical protein CCACVL1_04093 [Corchorus capsularis]|uniref:Uncharacterized protein n=1 Tax=Corchorus capsularis TaxID=210143 RepID=A0A1R3JVN1_COCAP|nr:hypothetical protein CCACVL1_04093 [Corchorus capsularis]